MESIKDIVMIEHDPIKIYNDAKAYHEELTGDTLPEADIFDIAYRSVAAMFSTGLAGANDAAKQNFLRFARGPRLDLKGELYGDRGKRVGDDYAKTTMRCYISEAQIRDVEIKVGTRFIKEEYIFSSERKGIITPGNLYTDIEVVAATPGYIPTFETGTITEVVDRWDFYDHTENITEVRGGIAEQKDDEYREMLSEIQESFSVAGPAGAYKFWALTASSAIKDVHVDSPQPCYIDIYVLGENGEGVSEEDKAEILSAVSQEKIAPLGDRIEIKDPEKIEYIIDLTYYWHLVDQSRITEMETALTREIDNYTKKMRETLGGDINPQDIIALAKNVGFKRVELRSPTEFTSLDGKQVGVCTNKNIVQGTGDA